MSNSVLYTGAKAFLIRWLGVLHELILCVCLSMCHCWSRFRCACTSPNNNLPAFATVQKLSNSAIDIFTVKYTCSLKKSQSTCDSLLCTKMCKSVRKILAFSALWAKRTSPNCRSALSTVMLSSSNCVVTMTIQWCRWCGLSWLPHLIVSSKAGERFPAAPPDISHLICSSLSSSTARWAFYCRWAASLVCFQCNRYVLFVCLSNCVIFTKLGTWLNASKDR